MKHKFLVTVISDQDILQVRDELIHAIKNNAKLSEVYIKIKKKKEKKDDFEKAQDHPMMRLKLR